MPDVCMSYPTSPSSSPPRRLPKKTNTLIVTSLPKELFEGVALNALRGHFESYGEIHRWVPLGGFGRIIIVYHDEHAAETAKIESDPVVLEGTEDRPQFTLRVFRADPNPVVLDPSSVPDENYLRPPPIEKNFLISPPGSPPVGWEPIREDPPNPTPLADDLIAALRRLQMRNSHSGLEVLLEPEDGVGVGVYVEDCDGYDIDPETNEVDWLYGQPSPRIRAKPIATALPPLPTAIM